MEDEDEIFVLHAPIWCLTRALLVHLLRSTKLCRWGMEAIGDA